MNEKEVNIKGLLCRRFCNTGSFCISSQFYYGESHFNPLHSMLSCSSMFNGSIILRHTPESPNRSVTSLFQTNLLYAKFEFLTAETLKIASFWSVTPWWLINKFLCFGEIFWSHLYSFFMKMEVTHSSEALVLVYEYAWHNIPEERNYNFLMHVALHPLASCVPSVWLFLM
jgi:hypothetical protein